jgi:hypothetical protein
LRCKPLRRDSRHRHRPAFRQAGIDEFDARPLEIDAGLLRGFADLLLAAEQDGGAEPLVHVGHGRAHHLLFLALGEDDAFRMTAHTLVNALQRRGDRIAPRRKLPGIGVQIPDLVRATPEFHRGLGDGDGIAEISRGSNGTGMM